ncbi:MAG TPA: xanthine dehydrogenase family protein subunit M [Xanthobacteraceae bacterium]|nr:xanthine dehydrogenase family protein subunit M [Xanthobacteraceae bacterium]
MQPFVFERVDAPASAIRLAADERGGSALANPAQYLAGGTTLLDVMKLEVMRPHRVIDINGFDDTAIGQVMATRDGIRLGALVRMAEAADNPTVRRDCPMIAQSLKLAASQQLRNMASLGGNVLQRTRCPYFRDVSYAACNKRNPGTGCAAMNGFNREHAVLGTSERCIATYPGDFAQAMIALDAIVETMGAQGGRLIPFAALHRPPAERPDVETVLQPGELITAFEVPLAPWMRRSLYLKVRDRESYEFALASAAVALDLRDGMVAEARIALGGVATVPWRATAAENALRGQRIDDRSVAAAAEAAFAAARGREHNSFKIALGKRTLVRALNEAAAITI